MGHLIPRSFFAIFLLLAVSHQAMDFESLARVGKVEFLYRNEVFDPGSQKIEAVLALKPPYQKPRVIYNLPGYRVEESQGVDLKEREESLLLVNFRGLTQAKPLMIQLFHCQKIHPFVTRIDIPDLVLPLHAGEARLETNAHTAILELKRALVSPYDIPPYVFEVLSYGFWDQGLSLNSLSHSKPQRYPEFFNLAEYLLKQNQPKKAILTSLRGFELLKTDPLLIPNETRAQVRLNLAKAYHEIKDYRRSKIILKTIEKELSETTSNKKAAEILRKIKRREDI